MRSEHPMAPSLPPGRQPAILADLLGPDEVLVAHCVAPSCGAATVLDLGHWRLSQLRFAAVARLEDELRCRCRCRCGALTARAFWGPRPVTPGRLYLFNA